ncbi:MAG: LysM peptidoglycan-binding domain-containing protein, partial [Burkholderiales bacterium]
MLLRSAKVVQIRHKTARNLVEVAMSKSITWMLLSLCLAAGQAYAQGAIALKEDAPDRYVVEKGDTLWSIATKFLKEPWRWPELWKLNQEQIKNPNRIFPGNIIILDRSAGGRLSLGNPIRLSPQVRIEPLPDDAIPAIRASVIEPYLVQPLVIEADGLNNAPRIVATEESRVNLGPGGLAYVSGIGSSKEVNWQFYRPGKPIIDPDTKRTLGFEAIFLGSGKLTKAGEPATIQIVTARQEISTGDRLVA